MPLDYKLLDLIMTALSVWLNHHKDGEGQSTAILVTLCVHDSESRLVDGATPKR